MCQKMAPLYNTEHTARKESTETLSSQVDDLQIAFHYNLENASKNT